jgi:KDO2-lipid IV(A) lauroyltransferase
MAIDPQAAAHVVASVQAGDAGARNALLARVILTGAGAVALLPVGFALRLGRGLGLAAPALLGTPRGFALAHVTMAFPEMDDAERRALVRSTFRHAGESYAELAVWRKLARRDDFVRVEGREALDAALAAGHGALAITGHVGNWELLAACMAAAGVPLTVVARKVNDQRFDDLITRFRGGAGMEIVRRDDPQFLSAVRDALDRNRVVALLVDQDSRGGGVFVPFFGRPAHTPPGAAVLALRTKSPVVSVFIRRRSEGGHVITFAPLQIERHGGHGSVLALTARFTAVIEAAIRCSPSEWVWWHERWRRQPPAARIARVDRAS